MTEPLVSVVIPCFNHGKYIEEAVLSVLASTYGNIEIIIVNDGSTDVYTNEVLASGKWVKTTIYTIANEGVSNARNFGIINSRGKYILPLDADDKISKDYISEASHILENRPEIKIVCCRVQLFGLKKGEYFLPEHSLETMIAQNTLVVSCMFRRKDFDATAGYRKEMDAGFEDWDFWLSLLESGGEVHRLPGIHFFYRIKGSSVTTKLSADESNMRRMRRMLYDNHRKLYSGYFLDPVKSFEYGLIRNSREYGLGSALMRPVRKMLKLFR